jgi:PAP2 superfamily
MLAPKRSIGSLLLAPVLTVLTVSAASAPAAAVDEVTLDNLTITANDNVVLRWNATALQAIRNATPPPAPPAAARALAITHTAMFDAWVAHDRWAVGTRLGGSLRRPAEERTNANKNEAISFAAYRTLTDLFPGRVADFDRLMSSLRYDPANSSTDPATAAGVGNTAAAALLTYRHDDGSNQLAGYTDTTAYAPVNTPDRIVDPSRWQPLQLPNGAVQRFSVPHWGQVRPFALSQGSQFRAPPPPAFGSDEHRGEVDELLHFSASLDDRTKATAEYWSDGPRSEQPPGHWCIFAQWVSKRDGNTLDEDVKLFFALTNAQFDASIAAWDSKRFYDNERPITGIRYLKRGQSVKAWAGPGLGTQTILGESWTPYFRPDVITPPFPDHVSGHSTFSAASATVLAAFTRSDRYGASATIPAGSSLIEPGRTPSSDVTLSWSTFSAAADEAGLSRRYAGIHYRAADLDGRIMGRKVGTLATVKAFSYIIGLGGPLTRAEVLAADSRQKFHAEPGRTRQN